MGAVTCCTDFDDMVHHLAERYGVDGPPDPTYRGCWSCGDTRSVRYTEVPPGWVGDQFMGPHVVAVCHACGWRHEEEIECE